ncbi:hypothetical protein AK88_03779 [Plasmodium fragile]|uniref:Uncharacterized protein n=1 Tax=Plasmodium fragile TaxID=5857 RepID=A0A0D9QI19_PLAFR|nr:uncharacterized protein AK88_03779 [Plasmodium fragile]KJP86583.1 hypothetical protein AK88_03779 [Plasmodium fragile]
MIYTQALKLEPDQQAHTSMKDVQEEVQDEIYDDGDDDPVEGDTDEGTHNDTGEDEDEDGEVIYWYDSEEEVEQNMEQQGFNSLVNDETIHMIHIQEYTDVDEEKEKVEELVHYMTNSLEENEQFVDTLSGFSDDITMYLKK